MVLEGKNFVDSGEAAAWYEEKVREVVNDDEIVNEISRFFNSDQVLAFYRSIATDYEVC